MGRKAVWPYEMVRLARAYHASGLKPSSIHHRIFHTYHPAPTPPLSTVREWLRNKNRKAA